MVPRQSDGDQEWGSRGEHFPGAGIGRGMMDLVPDTDNATHTALVATPTPASVSFEAATNCASGLKRKKHSRESRIANAPDNCTL